LVEVDIDAQRKFSDLVREAEFSDLVREAETRESVAGWSFT